jgi:hypothetical protein
MRLICNMLKGLFDIDEGFKLTRNLCIFLLQILKPGWINYAGMSVFFVAKKWITFTGTGGSHSPESVDHIHRN